MRLPQNEVAHVLLRLGGVFSFMVFVKAQAGDTSDSLIRKFTRKVLSEGILQDLKKREFYQKPAEIRKEKNRELARRIKHGPRA
jgi:ribosomal protein S21